MVDHVYADPASEQAWHEWYAGYLQKLLSVPGIHSAQRFRAIGCTPSRYLAMYSIESAAVYSSEAYKKIGGGGSQSARFHHAYRLWTRNLFEGASRAPAVMPGQRLLVFDRDEAPRGGDSVLDHASDRVESRATWLEAVGLHMTTKYRAFVVFNNGEVGSARLVVDGFVYEPFTSALTAK